ncbi:MAG: hypothetical protein V1878_11285 [bacterium]
MKRRILRMPCMRSRGIWPLGGVCVHVYWELAKLLREEESK